MDFASSACVSIIYVPYILLFPNASVLSLNPKPVLLYLDGVLDTKLSTFHLMLELCELACALNCLLGEGSSLLGYCSRYVAGSKTGHVLEAHTFKPPVWIPGAYREVSEFSKSKPASFDLDPRL